MWRLRQAQGHEYLRVLALDEERDALAGGLGGLLQLRHAVHALAIDAEDDVAGLHLGGGGGPLGLLDDQAPLRAGLLLLLRRERPHREAEGARRGLGAAARAAGAGRGGLLLLVELRDLHADVLLLAAAPQRE